MSQTEADIKALIDIINKICLEKDIQGKKATKDPKTTPDQLGDSKKLESVNRIIKTFVECLKNSSYDKWEKFTLNFVK